MIQRKTKSRKLWVPFVRSIFLRYIDEHPSSAQYAYFPPFFQWELEITDGYAYLRRMLRQGYLKKDEAGNVVLTDQGRDAIQDEHVRLFDLGNPYVPVVEYMKEKTRLGPDATFEEIMLSVLLKKLPATKEQDDFLAVENMNLDAALLYESAGDGKNAVYYYLTALYYETCGLEYYEKLVRYVHGKCKADDVRAEFRGICIHPEVMEGLRRLKDHLDPAMIPEIFKREQIAINMCTEKAFAQLVEELCQGTYDYNLWNARYEKIFSQMIKMAKKYKGEKKS